MFRDLGMAARARTLKAVVTVGPPLNKKSFPVHRSGGLKRANWDFFFHDF